jgi:hypothetical protein
MTTRVVKTLADFAAPDAPSRCLALARRVFASRGNNSEVHLSELDLAKLLGFAYELGAASVKAKP